MRKHIEKLFLYRHRLVLSYFFLAFAFFSLLSFLPTIAPGCISETETQSAITSSELDINFIGKGNIVDLPYRALQKLSINMFGVSLYSIKLPSIIIATLAGLFIILLLNRWFKHDVAIVSSMLTTLSTAFLFLAGNGTPLIMYVFWLAVVLWLGSKIVNNEHTHPLLVISFFICMALSLYTPHLLYVAIVIAIAGIMHPHLRFALKQINTWQLILSISIFVLAVSPLVIGCIVKPETIQNLLLAPNFNFDNYIGNISRAFLPFFSFSQAYDSVFLAPLFGLATISLIVIGILASVGKMFTSRNTVVSLLVIYSIFIAGFNPDVAITVIIPVAILTAAGMESIISKWYSMFPENPYAHLIGFMGVLSIVGLILGPGLVHYIYGYHYAGRVASHFNNDLAIIEKEVEKSTPLLIDEDYQYRDFIKLLDEYNNYRVIDEIDDNYEKIASTKPIDNKKYTLYRIITSSKSRNSDRLYIYSLVTE